MLIDHAKRDDNPAYSLTIAAIPLLVNTYRTWIRPYNISAADSINSFCSSVNVSAKKKKAHQEIIKHY